MNFHNDLIGYSLSTPLMYYAGSDREDTFMENVKKMPDDWYYRNREITYKYNKHGHRSIEIEDLDFNDYILFLGDSHTEGIGLELETTYPYLVSKKLNIPYYNLGLGGSGIDVMCYNLSIWLSKFPKPKFVVLYWSDPTRFIAKLSKQPYYILAGSWTNISVMREMIKYGEFCGYFDTKFLMHSNIVRNLLNHHKIFNSNISIFNDFVPNIPIKIFTPIDRARDLTHAGIKSNLEIADYLVSEYADKYKNATIHSTFRGESD